LLSSENIVNIAVEEISKSLVFFITLEMH